MTDRPRHCPNDATKLTTDNGSHYHCDSCGQWYILTPVPVEP